MDYWLGPHDLDPRVQTYSVLSSNHSPAGTVLGIQDCGHGQDGSGTPMARWHSQYSKHLPDRHSFPEQTLTLDPKPFDAKNYAGGKWSPSRSPSSPNPYTPPICS